MPQNSSLLIITPQSFHQLNLTLNTTKLATQLLTPLQHPSLMLNTYRPTSMMLILTNIIFCLISVDIFSISFLNTKNSLMAPLGSNYTKRFTLNSNLDLSRFITALTLYLTYTDTPLKKNLTTWSSVASSNLVELLNRRPWPSLSPKRWSQLS